eukprot:15452688-Alexandrium_andersonii.AAC.1
MRRCPSAVCPSGRAGSGSRPGERRDRAAGCLLLVASFCWGGGHSGGGKSDSTNGALAAALAALPELPFASQGGHSAPPANANAR